MTEKTKGEIVHLQNELNNFVERHPDLGLTKVRVDGDMGRLTKALIRDIKWLLGYTRKRMSPVTGQNFLHRMRHVTRIEPKWGQTADAVKRGKTRRAQRKRKLARDRITAFLKPGVGTFDGKAVAKCAIPILEWCRKNGWHGVLVSGYRSAAYSESLCMGICGRPSCPGRCAGRSTNHTGNSPARFAMDVSDYVNFGRIVAKCPIQPHVHNALPNDLVHFSPSGG